MLKVYSEGGPLYTKNPKQIIHYFNACTEKYVFIYIYIYVIIYSYLHWQRYSKDIQDQKTFMTFMLISCKSGDVSIHPRLSSVRLETALKS